jgi:hypothetical protein
MALRRLPQEPQAAGSSIEKTHVATPLKTVSLRPFIDVDRDTISCNHSYLLRRTLRSRHCYFCGADPDNMGDLALLSLDSNTRHSPDDLRNRYVHYWAKTNTIKHSLKN